MARTLTINGVVCAETLLSVEYGYASVVNYHDWLRNSLSPQFYGQEFQYTTAQYSILVEASNLGQLEQKCSKIYESMKQATIKDSSVPFALVGHTTNCSEERISGKARILKIDFEGVKTGDRLTITHTFTLGQTWTFEPDGDTETPASFKITADMGYVTLVMTLNGTQYKVKDVNSGDVIILDSETGQVTRNGVIDMDNYDSWSLPTLVGGSNSISFASGTPTVEIKYNGRWV